MHAHKCFHTREQDFRPRLPDLTKKNISLRLGNAAKAKYTRFKITKFQPLELKSVCLRAASNNNNNNNLHYQIIS